MRMKIILSCLVLLSAFNLQAQEEEDPLAALAALGDDAVAAGPEGGGSIRAKQDADLTRSKRLKDPQNLEAKVEKVITKDFPLVAIVVKVTKPAKKGLGKDIKKNSKLVITPKLKFKNKQIDMSDPETLINAGTFYLTKNDKIMVRLSDKKEKHWEAAYIERK